LINRNRTVLRRDVRANEVRVMEQRVVLGAVEKPGDQHGKERVTGADGVSYLDLESRVLGPSPVAQEHGAVSPARHAHCSAAERLREGGDDPLQITAEIEPCRQTPHLLLIPLHDVGAPERVADDLAVVVRRPQVHVQDLERASFEDASQRVTGDRAPLRERAEDDGLGCGCAVEQRARGLEVVPRRGFHDVVFGVAVLGDRDPNESGRQRGVDLQQVGADAVARHSPPGLVAELGCAHARDHRDSGAGGPQVTGDVEGRAAEEEAGRQGVPE